MSKDIINRDMLMITVARFLENEYGEGAVEALAKWKDERNRRGGGRYPRALGDATPSTCSGSSLMRSTIMRSYAKAPTPWRLR
jgi:hypothetical protein